MVTFHLPYINLATRKPFIDARYYKALENLSQDVTIESYSKGDKLAAD